MKWKTPKEIKLVSTTPTKTRDPRLVKKLNVIALAAKEAEFLVTLTEKAVKVDLKKIEKNLEKSINKGQPNPLPDEDVGGESGSYSNEATNKDISKSSDCGDVSYESRWIKKRKPSLPAYIIQIEEKTKTAFFPDEHLPYRLSINKS